MSVIFVLNFIFPEKSICLCKAIKMLSVLILFLFTFPNIITADDPPAYNATDLILLNCGADVNNRNDRSGRNWDIDGRSRYAPANVDGMSSAVSALPMTSGADSVPFQTARIIRSRFTYSFPVLMGHKFLRLYFNAVSYGQPNSTFDSSQSFLTVAANGYILLRNFSAFLNIPDRNKPYFVKEFIINVAGDQRINLTFTPNPNSTAFINGIEIVSLPDDLYNKARYIKSGDSQYDFQSDTALETLYRLNVGGPDVSMLNDSGTTRGMFRSWDDDQFYVDSADEGFQPASPDHAINYTDGTPPYSAPRQVYTTSRTLSNTSRDLRWAFSVDSGFYYMLRLHFCEIQLEVTKQNQRVFDININNQTADAQVDIIIWTGDVGIPIFKDYITFVADYGGRGKRDLPLSLVPNMMSQPEYKNVLLNGLEIFKLSDSNRNLAGENPIPKNNNPSPTPPATAVQHKGLSSVVYAVVGSVIGTIAVIAALGFLILRLRRRNIKESMTTKSSWMHVPITSTSTRTSESGVPLPSDLCRYFPFEEINAATNGFDSNLVVGKGGFGTVYKGLIDNAATAVAVKRLNAASKQGANEFRTEIEMLSRLRHLHLVSLIGYCNDNGEMILVYDYMANGTLRDHLYNSENPPLTWKQRLQICLGAARGLHYLHTSAKNKIIHRDVKSTNILLDDKWVAKMSDFGLSKVGPGDGTNTHVSTMVKGSFGYVDPEYFKRQQLTEKSDVYSFGVVLFEVLCARPAVLPTMPREKVNLAQWAKLCHRKGTLEKIIDPNLKDQIAPESLNKFVETAIVCLKEKGIERRPMSDVVWCLEFALQLQEAAEQVYDGDGTPSFFSPSPLSSNALQKKSESEACSTDQDRMFSSNSMTASWSKSSGLPSGSSDSENLKPGDVFSQLVNPSGR